MNKQAPQGPKSWLYIPEVIFRTSYSHKSCHTLTYLEYSKAIERRVIHSTYSDAASTLLVISYRSLGLNSTLPHQNHCLVLVLRIKFINLSLRPAVIYLSYYFCFPTLKLALNSGFLVLLSFHETSCCWPILDPPNSKSPKFQKVRYDAESWPCVGPIPFHVEC